MISRLVPKLQAIFRATYTHARNLASFVAIYKTLMLLLKQLQG